MVSVSVFLTETQNSFGRNRNCLVSAETETETLVSVNH